MADAFSIIAQVAEQKIKTAYDQGQFANLPGKGRPLVLEDDTHLAPELRMAYKILRNSGHLPPEIADAHEVRDILDMLTDCPEEALRLRQMRTLRVLAQRLDRSGRLELLLDGLPGYQRKILDRVRLHDPGAGPGPMPEK